MLIRFTAAAASALLLASCTFTPHDVEIHAKAPKAADTVGKGVTLYLQVIDDRESTVVGQRGANMMGADITATQIIPVLTRELKEGFEAKGFDVSTSNPSADAEVEARLRSFKFFIETGFFTGGENTSVVISIEAEKFGRDMDRMYRAESEQRDLVVPDGESIDVQLNTALTRVLTQIMSDSNLMSFLARRSDG